MDGDGMVEEEGGGGGGGRGREERGGLLHGDREGGGLGVLKEWPSLLL